MGAPESAGKDNSILDIQTILLALFFLLPGFIPILFGWIRVLLAIPICCLLVLNKKPEGAVKIRNGLLLAIVGATLTHQLPTLIFSMLLIPLGFSFNKSIEAKENEILTASKGIAILGLSWFAYWFIYGTIYEINPYVDLLKLLDTLFAQSYEVYKNNTDISPDKLYYFEKIVSDARLLIPKILPGLLACTLIMTVWLNLLGSITVLEKLKPGCLPWKKYSEWRLPDKVVWIPIVAGFAWAIGKGPVNSAGISLILVSTLLYFFQGLSVLIYFVDRWNIPLYMKILIYGILIFQSYGLLLLSIAGIADVWLDFRRRRLDGNQTDD